MVAGTKQAVIVAGEVSHLFRHSAYRENADWPVLTVWYGARDMQFAGAMLFDRSSTHPLGDFPICALKPRTIVLWAQRYEIDFR